MNERPAEQKIKESAKRRGFLFVSECARLVQAAHGVPYATALKAVNQACWRGTRGLKSSLVEFTTIRRVESESFQRWLEGYRPRRRS